MLKQILSALKISSLALLLSFGLSYALAAWTPPAAQPPNGNVAAPINVGATTQTKVGGDVCTTVSGVTKCLQTAGGGMPAGTSGQTLRHDGTDWVATSTLSVASSGNIGIGTTAPGQKLTVQNGSMGIIDTIQGSGASLSYNAGKFLIGMDSAGTDGIAFRTYSGGYAERLKISSNGNVGIGTSAPAQKLDVAGSAQITGTIFGGGAQATYGATTIRGDKNGWSGVNFQTAAGPSAGTLMMSPSYSGFYNAADNNWRTYTAETGVAGQLGNTYANDYYSAAAGKWMSQMGGGALFSTVTYPARSPGVTYTNTTGKPMFLSVAWKDTLLFHKIYVNGSQACWSVSAYNSGSPNYDGTTCIIPAGATYSAGAYATAGGGINTAYVGGTAVVWEETY